MQVPLQPADEILIVRQLLVHLLHLALKVLESRAVRHILHDIGAGLLQGSILLCLELAQLIVVLLDALSLLDRDGRLVLRVLRHLALAQVLRPFLLRLHEQLLIFRVGSGQATLHLIRLRLLEADHLVLELSDLTHFSVELLTQVLVISLQSLHLLLVDLGLLPARHLFLERVDLVSVREPLGLHGLDYIL